MKIFLDMNVWLVRYRRQAGVELAVSEAGWGQHDANRVAA